MLRKVKVFARTRTSVAYVVDFLSQVLEYTDAADKSPPAQSDLAIFMGLF